MTVLKTPTVGVDADFEYVGQITKTNELRDGSMIIRGVASGVAEDRDGERVSRRAIAKMVTESQAAARKGALALTSSHQQDWATEFGKVTALDHDRDTDELIVETVIPAPGVDPIADKARLALKSGKQLGFSIGGKLRNAYFERDEQTGKRRKVLDDIALRHVMLTEHPSYSASFAEAVAKSYTGDAPADDAFTETVDLEAEAADAAAIVAKAVADTAADLAKASKPGDDDDQPSPPAASASAGPGADGDTVDTDAKGADAADDSGDSPSDEPTDAQAAQSLPMAKRHLACPQCGHEFAADLPADEPPAEKDTDTNEDDAATGKSHDHQETTVAKSEKDTLAAIRALVEGAPVAKTDDKPEDVEKQATTEGVSDVEKMLAASHAHAEQRMDDLTEGVTKAFGAIETALKGVIERIDGLPQGRKSVARVLPTRDEVEKTATDDDEDAVAKADNPVAAVKALNAATRGIK